MSLRTATIISLLSPRLVSPWSGRARCFVGSEISKGISLPSQSASHTKFTPVTIRFNVSTAIRQPTNQGGWHTSSKHLHELPLEDFKDSPEISKNSARPSQNKPIEWIKVNDLPDHVAFNHSRHVTAGLRCQSCHGPIETEDRVSQADTLSMGMCVTCHRTHREVTLDENGRAIVSKEATPKRLMASTDCSVCHH